MTEEGEAIVLACADGAGSASHSDEGAAFVCQRVSTLLCEHLSSGALSLIDETLVRSLLRQTRAELEQLAAERECEIGDFACTILLSVIGETHSIWAQIGDGAIVLSRADADCRVVFWPQQGEYANVTTFLTSRNWETALEVKA